LAPTTVTSEAITPGAGGGDIKYFFCRYVGLGVEGFALDASKPGFDIFEDPTIPIFVHRRINHDHTIALF